jgi:hypothetical protein
MQMRLIRVLLLATIVTLPFPSASFADDSKAETIQITQLKEDYEVTVPVSQLIMTIPKGGLSQKKTVIGGSTASPRYFYFEDKTLQLIISGWFESEQRFTGVKKFWEQETKAYKDRSLPEPRDVSFVKIGSWDAIIYDSQLRNVTNSNIRAHWVQAGTWIDIHISITSDRPSTDSRAKLIAQLNSIQVREKK